MKNSESIEDLLQQIEDYKKDFYPRAIELHNNERLRSLVKCYSDGGIVVVKNGGSNNPELYYKSNGFVLSVQKYCTGDDWSDSGYYCPVFHNFKIVEDKLIAEKKELLNHFPKIKIDGALTTIEDSLKNTIKNLEIYKSAKEK